MCPLIVTDRQLTNFHSQDSSTYISKMIWLRGYDLTLPPSADPARVEPSRVPSPTRRIAA